MVERIFLGWERPILETSAAYLVDFYRSAEVADLRSVSIVVPGGRAMRRLKERLVDECRSRGLRLVPPRVAKVGALPEYFYTPSLPSASALMVRRAWATVLRDLPSEDVRTVFGEGPALSATRAWDQLGALAAKLQRETASGGHRFQDVAASCETADELLFDDSERWRILARAQEAYEALIRELGFTDPDLERIRVARRAGSTPERGADGDVWLVGVAELPSITARIIAASPRPIRALVHAPPAEADAFDEVGCVLPSAWVNRSLPIEVGQLRITDRPADQAAAVVEEIAGFGEVDIGEVVVGITDPALRPFVEEWLDASDVPTHYAGGVPIERSGPFRLLRLVAEFLEHRDWEPFAELIRHPDLEAHLDTGVKGPVGSLPDHADRTFQRHLPARVDRRDELLPTDRRHRLDRLLAPLDGVRELCEWPPVIVDFLIAVYGGDSLDPNQPAGRRMIGLLKEVRKAAVAIRDLPPRLSAPCSASSALRILLDQLVTGSIAEDAERGAVDLLGWLELPLDDASHVVIVGANEPMLPESMNADRFLPDRLRSRLGLLDNSRRFARDAFHATALVHSRSAVRFIAGRLTAAGDPLRPSRLLLARQGKELAERVLLFAEEGGASRGVRVPPLVAAAGADSRFVLPPVTRLDVPPVTDLYVTDFRRVLEDPFRFVLEKYYGLATMHDEARELDALAFGSLAHQVLSRFGRSPEVGSSEARIIGNRLDTLLDEEVGRRYGAGTFPAVLLQIEQLRGRLRRFADWHAERVAAGWRTVLVEGAPAGAHEGEDRTFSVCFDVDGVPIQIRGRIDRIDHHPETDTWAVLDYKTSDKPTSPEETHRRKRSLEWIDFQLPLYRHLARGIRDDHGIPLIAQKARLEMGYLLLSREPDAEICAMAAWEEHELSSADEAAREMVRLLREGEVQFSGYRSAWTDDPFVPLLGARLLASAPDEEELAAGVLE